MNSDPSNEVHIDLTPPSPDEIARARANRDPLDFVSDADWQKYRGQYVAILGGEAIGTIFASGSNADEVRARIIGEKLSGNDPLRGRAFTIRHLEHDD